MCHVRGELDGDRSSPRVRRRGDVTVVDPVLVVLVLGMSASGLVVAGGGAYWGYRTWRRRATKKGTSEADTTPIRDLTPGRVTVRGTAGPTGEGPLVEPRVSGGQALASSLTPELVFSGSGHQGYTPLVYANQAVPFVVEDDTGRVLVDPSTDGEFDLRPTVQETLDLREEPPEAVRRVVEENNLEEGLGTFQSLPISVDLRKAFIEGGHGRRRYSEGTVEPGEEVLASGEVREADPGSGGWDYVLDGGTDPESFVLSDKSAEERASEGRWKDALRYFGGVTLFLMGVLILLVPLVFLLFVVWF